MFLLPTKQNHDAGFTLIELLVVITIIAVLVGLLFPVGNAVMNSSRKTQASADETRILNACMAYQTDYGKLPVNRDNTGYETCYGDAGANSRYPSYELYDILRAINNPSDPYNSDNLNPRQVVYLQGNNAKNPSNPTSGFLLKDFNDGNYTIKAGTLVDPWGDEYVTFINAGTDPDLNGLISSYFYHDILQGQGPPGPIQIVSMGPDHDVGTKSNQTLKGSDDIVTW